MRRSLAMGVLVAGSICVAVGLGACSDGQAGPTDAAVVVDASVVDGRPRRPDLTFDEVRCEANLLRGCFRPCSDSRDCVGGPHPYCVDVAWFNFAGCSDLVGSPPGCVSELCDGVLYWCISDLVVPVDTRCQTDHVARLPYWATICGNVFYGSQLVYCPNGCEDTCQGSDCDAGFARSNSRCK